MNLRHEVRIEKKMKCKEWVCSHKTPLGNKLKAHPKIDFDPILKLKDDS